MSLNQTMALIDKFRPNSVPQQKKIMAAMFTRNIPVAIQVDVVTAWSFLIDL